MFALSHPVASTGLNRRGKTIISIDRAFGVTSLKARIPVKLSLKSNAVREDSFQNDVPRNAFTGI